MTMLQALCYDKRGELPDLLQTSFDAVPQPIPACPDAYAWVETLNFCADCTTTYAAQNNRAGINETREVCGAELSAPQRAAHFLR